VTGANKSGLYSEFKDKEDLLLASLERYAQTRGAQILTAQPMAEFSTRPLAYKSQSR
jgi:AcrR family transcriptional regulator